MLKIFVALVVVVAVLVGSCEAVRSPLGDTSPWYACTEGLLTGYPTLIGDQCTYESRASGYEYWRCPAPVARFGSRS
jgi:hypothetical protein